MQRHWRYAARTSLCMLGAALLVGSLAVVRAADEPADEPSAEPAADHIAAIDFNRDIRPILSDRCFLCHGPDEAMREQTGGLRLDTFDGATALLRDGRSRAIVPGDPAASVALQRMRSHDPDVVMPPPDAKLKVTDEEIARIERWIAQGAEYTPHWAFVAPKRPPLPQVKNESWVRDDLDRFVLARLEREGLTPAPQADRYALIRRVTFDLTGLPPTIEEVDAFIADESPDAYEKLVDRLLASPHFGERMAADWLDLARYSDTYGYQTDPYRDVYPYRDWVIKAFNDNLPYDDFITWQLAGDLLPNATREQKLATMFNRLHRQTAEGGSVNEEFRVEYVADRVHTFGTAMLGLTLECSRCHDHKYDPISQQEYYQLFAFFQNIDESGLLSHFTGVPPTPTLLLTTPQQDEKLAQLKQRRAEAEAKLKQIAVAERQAFAAWLKSNPAELPITGQVAHFPLDAPAEGVGMRDNPRFVTGRVDKAVAFTGDNNVTFANIGVFNRDHPFSVSLWIRPAEVYERAVVFHRSQAWTDSASQGYELLVLDGRLQWSLIHFWPGNAISVQTKKTLTPGQWRQVTVTYDGSSTAAGLAIYIDGERAATEVVRDNLFKSITNVGNAPLTLAERFRDRGFTDGAIDDVKVFDRALTRFEVLDLHKPGTLKQALANPLSHDSLYAYWLNNHSEKYRAQLAQVRAVRSEEAAAYDTVREVMTMREMDQPRPAFILERGSYLSPGKRVHADTPAIFPPMPADAPKNRLGLARWLTDPAHPLTARVAINRLWMIAYGQGLVSTAENFGSQGKLPTHPDLLDYLSVEFIASGWDTKAMLRRLVTSATYMQSSRAPLDLRERDPDNASLARGPLKRLTSEMMRDQALAASGLLVDRIGGPSVKPYQPPGLWSGAGASGGEYHRDTGEGLYRRSLYSFWKSTMPPPSMLIFDGAARDVCVARRQNTNTPLQALVLLNDPQFVEAARVLAQRLLLERESVDERIALAFRRLLTRPPNDRERAVLAELYREQLNAMRSAPGDAEALLKVGDWPVDAKVDRTELAAMTIVCSTLMSHDGAIMTR